MKKVKLMSLIKAVFLIAVVFFLIRYFRKNINEIKNMDFSINWSIFIVSMLFYIIYKITLALLWNYITKLNAAAIDTGSAVRAYLYSILGKYIPGKVFMLAARFPPYQEKNVPLRKVTVCFVLENICTLLGASFLFLLSLLFFPNDLLSQYWPLTLLMIAVFFVCVNPRILNFFLNIVGKILKKNDMVIEITYWQMIKTVLLFIGNWFIVGVGFFILTCSIYSLPVNEMLYAGGIFALSAFIGIISLFAPSGIGVREGVMIMGLGLIMPTQYAVIISIVSRLWATVAELLLIAGAFIWERLLKH